MALLGFFYRSPVHSRKHEFTCQQALGEDEEEEEEGKETIPPRPGLEPMTARSLAITSRVLYSLGHGATPQLLHNLWPGRRGLVDRALDSGGRG